MSRPLVRCPPARARGRGATGVLRLDWDDLNWPSFDLLPEPELIRVAFLIQEQLEHVGGQQAGGQDGCA